MSNNVGLDFGTTNSAIAVASGGQAPALARFAARGITGDVFRSILYFDPDAQTPGTAPWPFVGTEAMARYLDGGGAGRLLQSMKSFLASRLFTSTSILEAVFTLEELVAFVVRALKGAAAEQFGNLAERIVVGRPVHFSSAQRPEDDAFAVERLRLALAQGGFANVTFEYEPVAAAYHYERALDHDELILIADFGGGTSDLCLMHVGPGVRRSGATRSGRGIIATDGVPLAGDAFDSRLVQHLVAPRLGRGSSYRTMFGQVLPVPAWIYARLERWHHLSLLKTRDTLETLRELHAQALEPARMAALMYVIDHDLGFHLYRAVERTKTMLSQREAATFEFASGPVQIREAVTREQFESWIGGELAELAGCVDRLMTGAAVATADVDRVFLTGGSSFVPAVRRLFADRFGAGRIRGGHELTSVASGLALRAADPED